jgi:hypothetical protein
MPTATSVVRLLCRSGSGKPAQFDKAAADMEQALRVSNKKDDVHNNIAALSTAISYPNQRNLSRLDL